MLAICLMGIFPAIADSGDSGDCGYYSDPVDATFVDGLCVTDELGDYCDEWWYGQCPTWDEVRRDSDVMLFVCPPGGSLMYQASYSNGEGGGLALYFDSGGTLQGSWLWVTSYYFCCEGHRSFDYQRGDVNCRNGTPFEDTGHSDTGVGPDSNPDSPPESSPDSRPDAESQRHTGNKPPSACGCTSRNSGAAAVVGLLLLARRWFKR